MSRTHFPCAYFDIPTNSTLILCTHTNHPHWISLHTNTHSHQLQTSPPWWLANKPDITYMGSAGRVIGQMGCVRAHALFFWWRLSLVWWWGEEGVGEEAERACRISAAPHFQLLPGCCFFSSFCLISVVSEGSKARGRGGGKKKGVVHDGNMSVFNRPKIGCRIENGWDVSEVCSVRGFFRGADSVGGLNQSQAIKWKHSLSVWHPVGSSMVTV